MRLEIKVLSDDVTTGEETICDCGEDMELCDECNTGHLCAYCVLGPCELCQESGRYV